LPIVIGDFREGLGPVDQLIVVQENPMGNACNGGGSSSHRASQRRDL
jgi:hypothetical protein